MKKSKKASTSVNGQLERVPSGRAETYESPAHPRIGSYDTIVPQDGTDVNKQNTQNGRSYAIGKRQFGNQTAQESDYFYDEVKERLRGSSYETETNSAQIRRAVERLNKDGLDATVDYLLGIESGRFTTDDNVLLMAELAGNYRDDRRQVIPFPAAASDRIFVRFCPAREGSRQTGDRREERPWEASQIRSLRC